MLFQLLLAPTPFIIGLPATFFETRKMRVSRSKYLIIHSTGGACLCEWVRCSSIPCCTHLSSSLAHSSSSQALRKWIFRRRRAHPSWKTNWEERKGRERKGSMGVMMSHTTIAAKRGLRHMVDTNLGMVLVRRDILQNCF